MSDTLRQLLTGLRALAVLTVLLGIAYPVAVWGIGQAAFSNQAGGSLIVRDNQVVGSSRIGGEATEKLSLRGPELVGAGSSDPTFADFVERLGADPEGVAVAYAYTLESEVQVFAYQVHDTAPERLLDALQAAIGAQEATAGVTWTPSTLAERPVRLGTPADPGNALIYLHGVQDIGFIIVTDDPAHAAEVAGGLP